MKPQRVLLADDHALVRAGIRELIGRIEGVDVVAEAGSGDETLRLVKELKPDLVLLDLTMPGPSGFEVLARITTEFPSVRVIVLTVHDIEDYATRALRTGAYGYLPKSAASTELKLAIEVVLSGRRYLSPSIAPGEPLLDLPNLEEAEMRLLQLTPRQREVLVLVGEGYSTKDIARILKLSIKTVEAHRTQVMNKLNIHSIASLVRFAIKKGIVSMEEGQPKKKTGGRSNPSS